MEIILVFILGMVGAVLVQLSANKGVSRWIRYPLMALVVLFFGAVIALVFYLALGLSSNEPVASIAFSLLGLFLLVGTVLKFRKPYFAKRSDKGSGAINDKRA